MKPAFLLLLAALLIGCALPAAASADGSGVALLPFSVHAEKDMGNLSLTIPEKIKDRLLQEGTRAVLVTVEPGTDANIWPLARLRAAGAEEGAAWVVSGSFSMLGDHYSLDVKVLPVSGTGAAKTFTTEGDGMETLLSKVEGLSGEIAALALGRRKVVKIVISGNGRIEPEAVENVMHVKVGDLYVPQELSDDLTRIFAMGYFDDVRIESKDVSGGKEVTVLLVTKPAVAKVEITGNHALDQDDIREVMDVSRGSILNLVRLEENIKRIKALYKEKNYYNAEITYKIIPVSDNEADIELVIDEGQKVMVKEIRFEGNRAFSARTLRGVMKTKEKGIFSFITSSGTLDPETLDQDAGRLMAYYHNNGYVRAKVSAPEVNTEGRWIYITFKIEEGEKYKVGSVAVGGDLIQPEKELISKVKIGKEKAYNQEVVRADVLVLTDICSDEGYAFADVTPQTEINDETRTVDITYFIEKGILVYFNEIEITGNTKTRDYVIRREFPVYEQGLYNGSGLKRGLRNIARLDYFEDMKVDTVKAGAEDRLNLKVRVEEKSTSMFTFGGGYSSVDNAFFTASVTSRNLFGRGQTLSVRGRIGGSTSLYSISFTEPYLFGTRISFGTDLYNWQRDYDGYTKKSNGGRLRFGYRLWDYTTLYCSYGLEVADITDIEDWAVYSIGDLAGKNTQSTVSTTLAYDTRDNLFNPTSGTYDSVTVQYAGGPLGGDIAFTKYTAEAGLYVPLFWDFVGFLHAEGGYVRQNSDGILPVYERFYLGGINSLRGYTWEDLSPTDQYGFYIGGNKYIQGNIELLYPLIKKAGLITVAFYDTGDVYDNDQDINLGDIKKTWGLGVRWYSPMGPIRLEHGWPIDPPEGVSSGGRWEFAMGTAF
ncbi:MAG: outer membrane protein assembly factor BamA [Thermodesulfobacteriota bacterium]